MAIQGFISIGFDPASLSALAHFSQFPGQLEAEVNVALQQGGTIVAQAVEANTWTAFMNPTGALAGEITSQLTGTMEDTITVDKPYANRLEFGFHAADSLGRVYNNDPEPYAEPGLVASVDQVMALVAAAVGNVFASQTRTP